MKAITSSCSTAFNCRYRDGGYRDLSRNRKEICFFPSKMTANSGSLQLVSVQHRALQPATPCASLMSDPESEVRMVSEETQPQEDCSEKVHVKFQLQKECAFGEQFLLVGDNPMIGLWDPESAIPMNWSEGHVWSVEMDMPVGQSVSFKFILQSSTGEVMWQPGSDRNLTTWQSANGITVCEDWENVEDQRIMEENLLADQDKELALPSITNIVGEDLTTRIDQGSDLLDNNNYIAKEPLQATHNEVAAEDCVSLLENSMTIGSHNNSYPEEAFTAYGNKDNPGATSNDTVIVAEEHEGDNGLAVTFKNPKPENMEKNLITHEGDPGLEPKLTSSSTLSLEEEIRNENNITADASAGVDEAKVHRMPECDEEEGPNNQADTTKMSSDKGEEQQLNHLPTLELLQSTEEFPDLEPTENSIFDIILWARKTLEKILNLTLSLASETWNEL